MLRLSEGIPGIVLDAPILLTGTCLEDIVRTQGIWVAPGRLDSQQLTNLFRRLRKLTLMGGDIAKILEDWTYDPDSNVRKIVGEDGVQKIQVRVDQGAFQGILQLNLDGRPDGKRPHDSEFVLDHYMATLEEHRGKCGGTAAGFELDHESCEELFDESSRIYGRYVFLLQIKEYGRVVRDTERNMRLFDFVHSYAREEEDRTNLQKWWPYILRIHATASAMLAVHAEEFDRSLQIIEETRLRIDDLEEVEVEEFFEERERSRQALDELEEQLRAKRPLSDREKLEQELAAAIESEAFERAAAIRDQLKGLE